MQQLLGVDEPDFGVLTDEMFVEDGDLIDVSRLVQPRVEAELAFVMERDLAGPASPPPARWPRSPARCRRSRSWTAGSPTGRSSWWTPSPTTPRPGLLVVGGRMRKVEDLDLRLLGVVVSRNGEMIDTGAGAAALGNPARCVAWLANKLGSLGSGLKAGDIVLPGAVHKMVPVNPATCSVRSSPTWAPVTVRFSKAGSDG